MNIMDRCKKASKLDAQVLTESKVFNSDDMVPTSVPMINVALSGRLNGGLVPGLTVLAGPSKHFKTSFALLMAGAYLKAKPDAIMLFYDSEFGSPQSYFKNFGIDTDRVLHIPITNAEEFKFDVVEQLKEQITKDDDVIIVVDSIGNLASLKETEDALNEKSVADMSRAKAFKSVFRMVTPMLKQNEVPMLAINHTYKEIGLYPKDVVSGGTGIYYSADQIWIIGRQQDKVGTEIKGYHFIINIEKSRFVREKAKIPISVSWEGGIQQFSGLLDVALEGNFVAKPSNGWYCKVDQTTGELLDPKCREKDTLNGEFWKSIFANPAFSDFVEGKYRAPDTLAVDYGDEEEESADE